MGFDFNGIAEVYDTSRNGEFKIIEFIEKEVKLNSESRVLEIGCGTGNYTEMMNSLVGEMWGIDVADKMLDIAREKSPRANFIRGNAVELCDFQDEYFDCVYMVDVIHHIEDIDRMFLNITRILKKGAKVIVFSDSHDHIRNRLTTEYFPETLQPELDRYQDSAEIVESMRSSGLKVEGVNVLHLGIDFDFGDKFLNIAENKAYSMLSLISDQALNSGIIKLKKDMEKKKIQYKKNAPYVLAVKQ